MNVILKQSLGLLALTVGIAGCATPSSQQSTAKKPATKAPVVDRNARQPAPGAYPQPASRQPMPPQDDPLMPREYSSAYPAAPAPNTAGRVPATPPSRPYPSTTGEAYPTPPAYPPGAAAQPGYPPPAARPYSTAPAESYGRTAPQAPPVDSYGRTASQASPTGSRPVEEPYGAAPGTLPEPQPVVPHTPRTSPQPRPPADAAPTPAEPAVAMVPPAPVPTPAPAPAPRPVQSAPPADLPPAEITREGNQAVAALLENADKYVKSNQLDKAGAALERALRVEPRNAGIWHDLAQIRLHQGQYQQAESLASKSNNLASGDRTLQSRNWKVIASARKASGNAAGAQEAESQAAQLR